MCVNAKLFRVIMFAAVAAATCAAYTHGHAVVPWRRLLRTTPVRMMPEGPECKVHAESLHTMFAGSHELVSAAILSGRYYEGNVDANSNLQGRPRQAGRGAPPENWAALEELLPATVEAVSSRGKFIWWTMRGGMQQERQWTFWSTLGMTGSWSLRRNAHSRVAIGLRAKDGHDHCNLYYNDQRNFGTLTVCIDDGKLEEKLASLGPPWLGNGADENGNGLSCDDFLEVVQRQCKGKRSRAVAVAKFLMDQKKTSGVGNYILSEALYRARVWPWASCGDLSEDEWRDLHAAVANVINLSYASQKASVVDGVSTTRGNFNFRLLVYRQEMAGDERGLRVQKSEGPHGRAVFWVPQLQTRGRPPVDDQSGGAKE